MLPKLSVVGSSPIARSVRKTLSTAAYSHPVGVQRRDSSKLEKGVFAPLSAI